MDVISTLTSTVIFLFAHGGEIPIGTGFIVGYPVPNKPDQFVPLIVTAKHVVGDHSMIVARFSSEEGKNPVQVEFDINLLRSKGDLWEHQDKGVDIVVFRTPHFSRTIYSPIPTNIIATKEIMSKEDIKATDRVIFPSLLVNFMGLTKNYPVMRDGSIAVIPDEDVPLKYQVGVNKIETNQQVILINATSIPGASGSPIFLNPIPRLKGNSFSIGDAIPYLLGIMHGFYPAVPRAIQEIEESKPKPYFQENSGIAIIFPAWRLIEIFEVPAFTKRMDEVINQK